MNQFGPPATSLIYRIDDPVVTDQSQQAGHGTHTSTETTTAGNNSSSSSSSSGNKKRPASTSSSSSAAVTGGGGNQTGEGGTDPSSAAKKKKTTSLDPTTFSSSSSTTQRPSNGGTSYNPNVLDESVSTLFSTTAPTAPPLTLPQEDEECLVCGEGGMLILCDFPQCPRVYHKVLQPIIYTAHTLYTDFQYMLPYLLAYTLPNIYNRTLHLIQL